MFRSKWTVDTSTQFSAVKRVVLQTNIERCCIANLHNAIATSHHTEKNVHFVSRTVKHSTTSARKTDASSTPCRSVSRLLTTKKKEFIKMYPPVAQAGNGKSPLVCFFQQTKPSFLIKISQPSMFDYGIVATGFHQSPGSLLSRRQHIHSGFMFPDCACCDAKCYSSGEDAATNISIFPVLHI